MDSQGLASSSCSKTIRLILITKCLLLVCGEVISVSGVLLRLSAAGSSTS